MASLAHYKHAKKTFKPWTLQGDRGDTWQDADDNRATFWFWLMQGDGQKLQRAIGLVLAADKPPLTVYRSPSDPKEVAVEIHSVRTALRRTLRGETVTDLVVEVTQRRRGYFNADVQKVRDAKGPLDKQDKGDFTYRAGCTLLISSSTMEVRRIMRTPGTVSDDVELNKVRRFLTEGGLDPGNAFDGPVKTLRSREPFALLHRDGEE